VETPPVTVEDIEKSEYKEIWLSAMRAELNGHETAGTFSKGEIPKGVNIITAKWVFTRKTDSNGTVTKAKARLIARGFGQRFAVGYFETFAATPAMASIKLVVAMAVQRGWPIYHFDVTQAFVRAKLDTNVFMKLSERCGQLIGSTVRLDKSVYGVKQAERQWPLLLNKTLMVYNVLNNRSPTKNLGEVQWYMGCAIERNWKRGTMYVNQTTFVDTMLKRFEVTEFSDIPASVSADFGQVKQGEKVLDRPYRSDVGVLMWLARVTRPDKENAARNPARQSHDSCERHWRGVLKVLAYLNTTRDYGLTFSSGESRLIVYCDADYAKKDTDRRSISGVAVMYGGIAVSSTSRTQHCVTLSTTEAEYVAMAEGANE
ncbi:unnamed protein product, partial [Sphacelaria rigidula]